MFAEQDGINKRYRTDIQKREDQGSFNDDKCYEIGNTSLGATGCPASTFFQLTQMATGFGDTNRVGRTIRLTRVQWKMRFEPTFNNANGWINPWFARFILFVDKQQNGVAPSSVTEILADANGNAYTDFENGFYNTDNVPKRYEILADKLFVLPPLRGLGSGVGYQGASYDYAPAASLIGFNDFSHISRRHLVEDQIDIKLDIQATFGSAVIPNTNSIDAMLLTDDNSMWDCSYQGRLTFREL